MEQGHIQGDNMVECYLHHQLTPEERSRFEAHLVDCEECRDRVLLAEMFHIRNGLVRPSVPEEKTIYPPLRVAPLPRRARFVAGLEPWQIWLILIVAALLLVLIPTSYFVIASR